MTDPDAPPDPDRPPAADPALTVAETIVYVTDWHASMAGRLAAIHAVALRLPPHIGRGVLEDVDRLSRVVAAVPDNVTVFFAAGDAAERELADLVRELARVRVDDRPVTAGIRLPPMPRPPH